MCQHLENSIAADSHEKQLTVAGFELATFSHCCQKTETSELRLTMNRTYNTPIRGLQRLPLIGVCYQVDRGILLKSLVSIFCNSQPRKRLSLDMKLQS